jgi:hypothetical protein
MKTVLKIQRPELAFQHFHRREELWQTIVKSAKVTNSGAWVNRLGAVKLADKTPVAGKGNRADSKAAKIANKQKVKQVVSRANASLRR